MVNYNIISQLNISMKKYVLLLTIFIAIYTKKIQSNHCLNQQTIGKCNQCQQNYQLIQGLCYPIVQNCEVYESSFCKVCRNPFILQQNKCKQKENNGNIVKNEQSIFTKIKLQQNCQQLNSNGTCKKCLQKYHIYQGQCFYNIGGCKEYHKGRICKSCESGYLLINNYCNSQCSILCNTQFGKPESIRAQNLHDDTNFCCQFVNGLCIRCIKGYYFKDSKCIVDDRQLNEKKKLQYCLIQDRNGKCAKCNERYYIKNDICEKVQQNCQNYLNNGICLNCYPGYYLTQNKVCQLSNPLFKEILANGKCRSCYAGYSLKVGICVVQIDVLCVSYDENNKCMTCSNRSYLKQEKCQKVDQYCNIYDQKSGKCKDCYLGYKLQNNKCILE